MKPLKQRNLGGCSVGITEGSDLRGTQLRWLQMARNTYQVSRRLDPAIHVILGLLLQQIEMWRWYCLLLFN
jgi:hypothetical protein